MARTGFGRKSGTAISNGVASSTQVRSPEPARPAAGVSGAPAAAAQVGAAKPSMDQLRLKAYEVYLARTKAGRPGDPTTDWLEAERQLKSGPTHSGRHHP